MKAGSSDENGTSPRAREAQRWRCDQKKAGTTHNSVAKSLEKSYPYRSAQSVRVQTTVIVGWIKDLGATSIGGRGLVAAGRAVSRALARVAKEGPCWQPVSS